MTGTELYYDMLKQRDAYLAQVVNGDTSINKIESMDMLLDAIEQQVKGLEGTDGN